MGGNLLSVYLFIWEMGERGEGVGLSNVSCGRRFVFIDFDVTMAINF